MINLSGKTQNGVTSGIMQPCNAFIQSRGSMGVWGGMLQWRQIVLWLTYFSFWEGLLWPASALNCALYPESKGKPKMKKNIERDNRKSKERRDGGGNKPQCTKSLKWRWKIGKRLKHRSIWIEGSETGRHVRKIWNDFIHQEHFIHVL